MDRAVAEGENVLPDCCTKQSPARKPQWLLRADLTAEAGRHELREKDSIPSPGLPDPRGFSILPAALPLRWPKPTSFDPIFVLPPVGHGGTLKGLGLIQLFVGPSLGPLQVSLA